MKEAVLLLSNLEGFVEVEAEVGEDNPELLPAVAVLELSQQVAGQLVLQRSLYTTTIPPLAFQFLIFLARNPLSFSGFRFFHFLHMVYLSSRTITLYSRP
jgi:hypothetical protein